MNSEQKITIKAANLSLIGIPFISGFYSKDLILENIITKEINISTIILIIASCVLTPIYTIKLIHMLFTRTKTNFTIADNISMPSIKIQIKSLFIVIILITTTILQEINLQTSKPRHLTKKFGLIFLVTAFLAKFKAKKITAIKIRNLYKLFFISKETLSNLNNLTKINKLINNKYKLILSAHLLTQTTYKLTVITKNYNLGKSFLIIGIITIIILIAAK